MRITLFGIAVTLAAAVPCVTQAQRGPVSPMFGIHGGLSYSTASSSDEDVSYRAGFAIGAYLEQRLADSWTIQPEIQYIQKGAKSTSTEGGTKVTADVKLSYIEIPVFLRLNGTKTSSGILPFAQLGPQISFKAGCDASAKGGGVSLNLSCDSAGLDVSSVDFGIIGGAGVDMTISGQVFTGVVRYDFGLKNVSTDSADDGKNRSLTVLVGWRW